MNATSDPRQAALNIVGMTEICGVPEGDYYQNAAVLARAYLAEHPAEVSKSILDGARRIEWLDGSRVSRDTFNGAYWWAMRSDGYPVATFAGNVIVYTSAELAAQALADIGQGPASVPQKL